MYSPQVLVAQKVTTGVYKGVTTSELDDLAAETAASMTATHPDYATVGAPSENTCAPDRYRLGGERQNIAETLCRGGCPQQSLCSLQPESRCQTFIRTQ